MAEKTRERIIEAALELFNHRGYRNVTLSQLANHLGMSKRTLYLHFKNKEEVAEAVFVTLRNRIHEKSSAISESHQDPLNKLRGILDTVRMESTQINPLLIEDIQKYAPDLRSRIEEHQDKQILRIEDIILAGQNQGLIRKNINPELTAKMYCGIVNAVCTESYDLDEKYSVDERIEFIIDIFFNGICEKGEN